LLKNIGSNWVRNIVTAAFGLVTLPYIYKQIGAPSNIWVVINDWTGTLMLLALGIPMAASKIFSSAVAKGDTDELNEAVSASAVLYLMVAGAALVVGAVLFFSFDASYVQPRVAADFPDQVGAARSAFALVVVFIALNFLAQLPIGVMIGHQDFVTANIISTSGVVVKLGLVLTVLLIEPTIVTLAVITVGVLVGELIAGLMVVRRKYPRVKISLSDVRRSQLKKIVSFSLWVLLLNLGIKLCFFIDGIVLGAFGEFSDPYQYRSANHLMVMLIEFLVAIGAVALPRVAHLQVKGDDDGIRTVYLQWTKVAFSLTLMAGLYLMVLGPAFLSAWMGPEFEATAGNVLIVLMGSSLLFMPIRGVSIGVLMGLGKAKAPGLIFLGMGILNLILSLILVFPLGIMGVALGTAIPNVIFAVLVSKLVCMEIGLPYGDFLKHVCGKALIGVVPVLAGLFAIRYGMAPEGFLPLVLFGIAHCVVFGLVWATFVYRNDPHIDVMGRLRGLLRR